MKSFLFENISLLSRKDRRARAIAFHPRKNLIVGRNHTGKSSLIRSLFLTLGAKPKGELADWDESTISEVVFSIDGARYSVLHQNGRRAIFNGKDQLLAATTDHANWSTTFAETVGFNLVLTDKDSETALADPHCFFLPFYINQDGSWTAEWDTFPAVQRYKAPIKGILEYFSGIKPPEYYRLHSLRIQMQRTFEDLQREHRFLEKARERFGKSLSLTGPKLEASNFEQDIARLTTEVTELNREQEKLRDTSVREQELLSSIRLQIKMSEAALHMYDRDSVYLRTEPRDILTCPTCGAEHNEPFLEILLYAEDARVLRELVSRLSDDARKALEQYRKTQQRLRELDIYYGRVAEILAVRRGDMEFHDVVKSMGAESAFEAFAAEGLALQEEINKSVLELHRLNDQLKELTDAKRTKQIMRTFRDTCAAARNILNLPSVSTDSLRLTSRPNVSGSGGPRSILSYYGALWRICSDPNNGAFGMPLVIDAPNQQGQDFINLPKVLQYLATSLPANSQVIVCSEIEAEDPFENRIHLEDLYKLLREDEYDGLERDLEPKVKAMYEAIQKDDKELNG